MGSIPIFGPRGSFLEARLARPHPSRYLALVTRSLLLAASALVAACVEPLAEDEVPVRDIVFDWEAEEYDRPTPREVEASSHDWGVSPVLGTQIAQADGIDDPDGLVPRLSGFADEERIWFWSFGPTPTFAAPLWKLVSADDGTPINHPLIWDVVPGDRAYSPFWRTYTVAVTDRYNGERILSRRGLDEALRLGLIEAPEPTGIYSNCPVVDEDVRMQVRPGSFPGWEEEPCPGNENATCIAPHWAYYKGVRVFYFDTNGGLPLDVDEELPVRTVYELRRETEALPLSEPVRGVDITGDADAVDTNDVFPSTPCDDDYSPVYRTTQVFVAADYASIDTNADETVADATQVSDLFDLNGVPRALVRGLEPLNGLRNLAVESPAECPPDPGY
jgi:hypothetical protein